MTRDDDLRIRTGRIRARSGSDMGTALSQVRIAVARAGGASRTGRAVGGARVGAFLAERVLGNVVASGVKVLVLAVIVGIGSTMFDTFVNDFSGQPPALEDVLAITLAALTLTGLSIFGPGIASGLVSGAPQLSAGAAIGTGLAVGGVAMAGAAGARLSVQARR